MIGLNFQICQVQTCWSVNGHPIVPTFLNKKYGCFKWCYPKILGKCDFKGTEKSLGMLGLGQCPKHVSNATRVHHTAV